MDILKQTKKSKSVTFTGRGGFFTFWTILAHSAAGSEHHIIVVMFQKITRTKRINIKNKNAANYRKDVIPL